MRVWPVALVLTLGATAAHAQLGVPFGTYEPTPAYLGLGHNDLDHCSAPAAPAYPYNRDVRRGGGQPSSEHMPPPDCPAR
jgi:hypothetical protein